MKKINKSITYQSLFYILLIYILVTLFVTAVHFFIELNLQKKQLQAELQTLIKASNRSITTALWDMNHKQIEAEANGIMNFPIVKALKIEDKDKNSIISMSVESICKDCKESYTVKTEITKSIFNKDIHLGNLILYSNFSVVLDRIKVNFSIILLSALIKSALLVFLFIVAFRKYLFTPLNTIVSQIDSIDVNNLEHTRIKYKSNYKNELTSLKTSVNTMLKKLEEQLDTLQHNEQVLQETVKARTKELEEKNKQLEHIAITDSLTSLYNRRKIDEKLENEIERAKRLGNNFGVIMLDIDYFKQVNDTFGHQVGDTVLVELSSLLKQVLRKIDIIGRWGGEEFIIICPGSNEQGIVKVADNLQEIIQRHEFPIVGQKTASFGATIYHKGDSSKELIYRVDEALYRAKENGRNRVELN